MHSLPVGPRIIMKPAQRCQDDVQYLRIGQTDSLSGLHMDFFLLARKKHLRLMLMKSGSHSSRHLVKGIAQFLGLQSLTETSLELTATLGFIITSLNPRIPSLSLTWQRNQRIPT